jgi:hypothetical protein
MCEQSAISRGWLDQSGRGERPTPKETRLSTAIGGLGFVLMLLAVGVFGVVTIRVMGWSRAKSSRVWPYAAGGFVSFISGLIAYTWAFG